MELNISNIIENEDKKNPYTDEEIASRLGILRENVTEYRKQNGIPDSRLRRKESILKDAFEILNENPDMSDRGFTQELVQRGYKIARYAALTVKKEAEEELYKSGGQVKCKHFLMDKQTMENAKSPNQKGNNEDNKEDINEDAFRNIIGYDGSLKIQVNQAKAAVLYPPKGLHTLLLGPSGVGKSYIAEAMYNFARTTENFSHDAPFMIFNCADYADNPQLLLSQLFGYSKGAFTGASEDKKGIVEMTNGGILFLDEIHRLPPEGQEILFYLLDKGKFRRLGETEAMRESQVMVIAATTENPDSSLLLTFRRRIPMVIQIPSLKERSHLERFSTIKSFFLQESIRLGKDIMVMRDVIKAFMTYECPGNIGQLRSDIQVACARGFLSTTLSNEQIVKVKFNDIPSHVKEGAVNFNYNDEELEKYTSDDIRVSSKGVEVMYRNDDRYVFSSSIYQFIEDKYSELKNSGYDDSDINKKLGEQLEREIMRVASTIKIKPQASREELGDIVGEDILQVAEEIVSEAQKYIKGLLPSVFYPLAIHLSSTYERLMKRKEIINPKLDNLKEKYKKEYEVAKKMARIITKRLHISLPEDEIGFIAMYLKNFQEDKHSREGLVSVLVLSHGRVATGMAEVANKLLGVNHAVGLEMALSDSPNIMLEKAINTIKSINQGK
ncbi:sigma-54-dependent transcriptional regulator [Clostridium polynesiense]|uniref:sigma-54-dependent transcriptional regulator n=1 Tax=Clostridium polynesiense TaxID=1325933 RepID=UPI000A863DD7|nr:sigma 54-interacting transcriptional regulator [Clostridium polynesiense]